MSPTIAERRGRRALGAANAGRPAGSMAPLVGVLAHRLGPALVGPTEARALTAVASEVPRALGQGCYFECRLRDDAPLVDLSFEVTRERGVMLSGGEAEADFATALTARPAWQRVRSWSAAWSGGVWRDLVRAVWLEFDVDSARGARALPPVPGVFLEFDHGAMALLAPNDRAATLITLATSLRGRSMSRVAAAAMRRTLGELPETAAVAQLGIMLGRNDDFTRLCLTGFSHAAAVDYLVCVGATGVSRPELGAWLEHSWCGAIHRGVGLLHVDVDARVHARVGWEYTLQRGRQYAGALDETPFLDALVAQQLCTPVKRDALLAWCGRELVTLPGDLLPTLVFRRINHIKVVHGAGMAPEAKAYLCALAFASHRTSVGASLLPLTS